MDKPLNECTTQEVADYAVEHNVQIRLILCMANKEFKDRNGDELDVSEMDLAAMLSCYVYRAMDKMAAAGK